MSTMAVFHDKQVQIASDESVPFAYRGMLMSRLKLLQIALFVFGIIFCLVYPLAIVWPSGWAWHDGPPAASHYFMMIVGIYATLGMFLVRASRDPVANRSLIDFTIWSSVVHALIMAVQSYSPGDHMGHMLGDVPALLLVAAVLGGLTYSGGARTDRSPGVSPG